MILMSKLWCYVTDFISARTGWKMSTAKHFRKNCYNEYGKYMTFIFIYLLKFRTKSPKKINLLVSYLILQKEKKCIKKKTVQRTVRLQKRTCEIAFKT